MYEKLDVVTLKTGEKVECGVVRGSDADWAQRLEGLLGHKGEIWRWQNTQMLKHDLGIEVYYYILHRDGQPLTNVTTVELDGVGSLGHVFTMPEDRRKHASTLLMQRQMEHFRQRGGRMLILGTTYDSPAFHIYRSMGFESVEPLSAVMAYYRSPPQIFEQEFFNSSPTVIETFDWRHYPVSGALLIGDYPGVVRCAMAYLVGRRHEGSLLSVIRRQRDRRLHGQSPTALVLRNTKTSAVVGLAQWDQDPLWPSTYVVDIYCHPRYWGRAPELLRSLTLPPQEATTRVIAYADSDCPEKLNALRSVGFVPAGTLPRHVAANAAGTRWVDLIVLERNR